MGIDLCRTEGLVPEQFLYGAEVGTVVQEVGCERVSQGVWADLRIEACFLEVLIEFAPDGS